MFLRPGHFSNFLLLMFSPILCSCLSFDKFIHGSSENSGASNPSSDNSGSSGDDKASSDSSTITSEKFELNSSNQGHWRPGIDVGVEGGIEEYLAGATKDTALTGNVLNMVTQFGADPTGKVDVRNLVVSAISAASEGDVIFFPAGTYLFEGGFIYGNYKDRISIRGAGAGRTVMLVSTSQPIFSFNDPGNPDGSYVQEILGEQMPGGLKISQ